MKNMFQPGVADEIRARLANLRPDSTRQWGTMTPSQVVEHLRRGLELATGERRPPRKLLARILGPLIKPLALGNDAPMRRNSPTAATMVVTDDGDFAARRTALVATIDRFVAAGASGCTTHPHAFFGRLTPDEWSVLMYKHLDHHLRQFGV